MGSASRQANFLLPEEILEDLRATVPARSQSRFVAEALRKELRRIRLAKVLDTAFGAWKDGSPGGEREETEAFVRELRRSARGKRTP